MPIGEIEDFFTELNFNKGDLLMSMLYFGSKMHHNWEKIQTLILQHLLTSMCHVQMMVQVLLMQI